MDDKDKNHFLTTDRNMTQEEIDAMYNSGPLHQIKSAAEMQELSIKAMMAYANIGLKVQKLMTIELATTVKRLRMVRKYSYRALAAAIYDELTIAGNNPDWQPASNQLAGIQLCEQATKLLHETID